MGLLVSDANGATAFAILVVALLAFAGFVSRWSSRRLRRRRLRRRRPLSSSKAKTYGAGDPSTALSSGLARMRSSGGKQLGLVRKKAMRERTRCKGKRSHTMSL